MFNIKTSVFDYMSIVLTHRCNKACKFCIDKYRGIDIDLSIDNLYKALTVAKDLKIKDILFVGGEPFLSDNILEYSRIVKRYGFNLIITTNYHENYYNFESVCKYANSINISWHKNMSLPSSGNINGCDITLSAIISKDQLSTQKELDCFIDIYGSFDLKFSTLVNCNDYTKAVQEVKYLDFLPGRRVILFEELEGIIYRGYVIKRQDKVLFPEAKQSIKCLANGEIKTSWEMTGGSQNTEQA